MSDDEDDDLFRAFWLALVAATATFLRLSRKRLGMRHGEKCPRCGHSF